MTDQSAAPSGGNDISVIEAPAGTGDDLSVSQATAAFMKARAKDSPAESADDATAENELSGEDNAAPVEEQAHGEDEGADPVAEPPIARPKSWTEADEADWQATPRKQQEKIVARELERDTALRRAQNEAAEKLKGLTTKEQQLEQARKQYEAQLPNLMQTLQDAQQASFGDIKTVADVERLQAEDPFRFQAWQVQQMKLQAAHAENERVKSEQTQKQQTDWNQHVQRENELAAELIPELADKDKNAAFYKRAVDRLAELGFKQDEVRDLAIGKERLSLHDHRLQVLLASDFKLADIQKAKTAVTAKQVPPVQRPGVQAPRGDANSDQIKALTQKLNETGDIRIAQQLRALQSRAS